MDPLKLTEQEQRNYAELFSVCDLENTGKVTGVKAFDLFLTSGLTQDVLHKIMEMCGAKRLGHFGRSQFYIALKLIVLAQNGLPISYEGLNLAGAEFPLPVFGRMYTVDGRPPMDHAYNQHLNEQGFAYDRSGQGGIGGIPPPPKHPRGSIQMQRIPGYDNQPIQVSQESPADTLSPQFSPNGSPPVSPGQHPVEPPSTRTTHHSGPQSGPPSAQFAYDAQHQRSWAQFDEDNQGLLSGVQGEQKQWANFSDHKADTSSISSEAESVDDVWTITEEQHEYYVNQFTAMQPDTTGVIPGSVAKQFFEKSKLPVQELSKIWQLSDVDRDGGLSLEEFCTAMHLVVLRRNDIELPEHLPPALMPYVQIGSTEEPFAADLPQGSTLRRATPPSPTPPSPTGQQQWPVAAFPPPQPASPNSSTMSSPGTKPEPVKFGFQPVMSDPDSKIVHPVPMRVSPDGAPLPIDGLDRPHTFLDGAAVARGYEALPGGAPTEQVLSPTKPRTPADLVDAGPDHHPGPPLPMPLQGRPRPTPKKAQSIPGPSCDVQPQPMPPVRRPLLGPPPGGVDGADRPTTLPVTGEMAPPPPPRSKTGHSRSSSLDNQLIDFGDSHHQGGTRDLKPPPAVPPRPSPKDALNTVYSQGTAPVGAADVRDMGAHAMSAAEQEINPAMGSSRNLLDSDDETRDETDHNHLHMTEKDLTQDRKELKAVVRKHRERNNMLLRLNSELNQELQEVMEQRIALEIQLEHLRPFPT